MEKWVGIALSVIGFIFAVGVIYSFLYVLSEKEISLSPIPSKNINLIDTFASGFNIRE